MHERDLQIFDVPLRERIDQMTNALSVFVGDAHLPGTLASTLNILQYQVAWLVQYRPHDDPRAENIDIEATLTVDSEHQRARFNCDLIWSHGVLIKPYAEDKKLSYQRLDELVLAVCQQWDRLMPTLLEDMKREMLIDRPPVYRDF